MNKFEQMIRNDLSLWAEDMHATHLLESAPDEVINRYVEPWIEAHKEEIRKEVVEFANHLKDCHPDFGGKHFSCEMCDYLDMEIRDYEKVSR